MISEVHTQTGLLVLIETLIYNIYKDTGQAFILQIIFTYEWYL